MSDDRTVCNGCWKRGYCENADTCRCPCEAGKAWKHAEQIRDEKKVAS